MNLFPTSLRKRLRLIHILASVLLGAFLYSPLHNNATMTLAMTFCIFPIVALSGLWLWQGQSIVKILTPRKSSVSS